jgi:hypothetical protein
LSAPHAGGRSLVGLLFRLFLSLLVVIAIVVVIIAALVGKPDSANELNLNPSRWPGSIRSRTPFSVAAEIGRGPGGSGVLSGASCPLLHGWPRARFILRVG